MERPGYELIALDMDGTLLNSGQEITLRAKRAVEKILERDRQVVFATGRCRSQVEEYLDCFPGMRYLICENGASVCDLKKKTELFRRPIAPEHILRVLEAAESGLDDGDIIVALCMGNRPFMDQKDRARLEEFGLGSYRAVYEKTAVWVEGLRPFYLENPLEVEKVNLFFKKRDVCSRICGRLRFLPLSLAVSASGNLEITGRGVNKGSGLALLCGRLGLPAEKTAAVGDGRNDLELFRTAGLAIAMENACPEVRREATATVPDCDHDGAAVAMERYML